MANDYQKLTLSGSTDGAGIKITTTATAGDLLHTATTDNTGNVFDEVWLWAYNSSGSAVLLTLEFAGVAVPDNNVKVTVPSQSGLLLVLPGFIMKNTKLLRAFAATANVIAVSGYVNRVTHS